jgi:hypothetical protein
MVYSNMSSIAVSMGTWHDPDLGRPIAAPLQRCAELLGLDLATVRTLATKVEPYLRADGTRVWSLMQLNASWEWLHVLAGKGHGQVS